jgi:predicted HAD superfamily hydrolase
MNKHVDHWDSYGVFIIANAIIQEDPRQLEQINRLYGDCIDLYYSFLKSKFNSIHSPELDCIYNYLKDINLIKKTTDVMPDEIIID